MVLEVLGLFCGSSGKESAYNAGDLGLIPGSIKEDQPGRSTGEVRGYPLLYCGLENSMDCVVHGVTKSLTQLSNFHLTSLRSTGPPTITSSSKDHFKSLGLNHF